MAKYQEQGNNFFLQTMQTALVDNSLPPNKKNTFNRTVFNTEGENVTDLNP